MTMATATASSHARRPSLRRTSRSVAFESALAIVVVLAAVAELVSVMVGQRGLDTGYLQTRFPVYLDAVRVNLYATTLAFIIGMGIGFLVGWARTIRVVSPQRIVQDFRQAKAEQPSNRTRLNIGLSLALFAAGVRHILHRIADAYVEIIRGTPLLTQIVFAWAIVITFYAQLGTAGALLAGIAGLIVNTGGYQGEIFRAGLQTVQSGQVEAARGLGLSRWRAMRYVVLPQALRLVIPPLTNEFIGLFKASSLLYFISVAEVTFLSKQEAYKGHPFESFAIITGIFLLITIVLSRVLQFLEQRFRVPGLGIELIRE